VQRLRVLAVTAVVLAGLAVAAPAAAFSPPELFVRMQPWETHEPVGDWLPLASAPALEYVGGYEIGYRLQASGEPNQLQRVALAVTGVPDGQPSQPYNATPYCVTRTGAPGDIVAAGPELQFEGDGAYGVKVSVGPSAGGGSGCLSGESSTGSFTVVARSVPSLVGSPLSFRTTPAAEPFVGLRATAPPGGLADIRCALDATVAADGTVSGPVVVPENPGPDEVRGSMSEDAFPRPGVWTCVARAAAEGVDDSFSRAVYGGSWSAPLRFDVRSDFRRKSGRIDRTRARRPRFTFTAEWPAFATGGRATITLFRVTGCRDRDFRLRRVARIRGRFGARRAQVSLRRPHKPGYYIGRFAFGGTRFLRASTDPVPMFLVASRRSFGFAGRFARCPGYLPPS
jgi:hypothetical protein